MTTALAIYAAVVASGGFGWQIYTWRHGRQAHLTVTIKRAYPIFADGTMPSMVSVKAVSHTGHELRATNAAIQADSLEGQTWWAVAKHDLSSIPGPIPAFDAAEAFFDADKLTEQGVDFKQPVRGGVKLSNDDIVWSELTMLG